MIYTINEIREKISPIAEKYKIPAIYMFGSYARESANENSDLDFIVDTEGTNLTSLFSLGELYSDMEETFGKRVDLVTLNALKQDTRMESENKFRETVLKEKVSLYGKDGFTED